MKSSGPVLESVCVPLSILRQACIISQNGLQSAAVTNNPIPNLGVLI